ncbi:MAG: TrmB family transcriptional regulator [Nitrospirae bacterium]|jgi:HTH-type transcriptional regulator, sugar sensing transcriptional regulator|nr:TrmB family transcriptional regulator [Nitrospirota bacterium]
MEKIISELMQLGLSEYEAKAYLSLLRENPSTAYEIGKDSGIPTSKVYEVLKKLIEKGIISIIDDGKKKHYVPLAPDEFLNKQKSITDSIIDSLRTEISNVRGMKDFSHICTIYEYEYLMDRIRRMIGEASRTILLSIWKEEFEKIEEKLRDALGRKVRVAIVHFGQPGIKIGQMYPHPVEHSIYQEKVGRGIVIVTDSRKVLAGNIFKFNRVEGAWSMNRGFVTLAEDYIKHDIYIMKIVRRFDRVLKEKFGLKYEKLRDIFTDN